MWYNRQFNQTKSVVTVELGDAEEAKAFIVESHAIRVHYLDPLATIECLQASSRWPPQLHRLSIIELVYKKS